MSTVNFYDVLNISQDSTIKEIKFAYRKLVKEFHPSAPNGDAEMLNLVTHAYNILSDSNSRKEYDEIYTLSKQVDSSHIDLKLKAKNYYEAQKSNIKSKDEHKKDFETAFDDMDRKRGYKRDKDVELKISEKDTKSRLRDLEMARTQDDIENIHDKLFDGPVNMDLFNAAFDDMNKKHHEMIIHEGNPEAWNPTNNYGATYSSINNYEDLYAEDDNIGNSLYGSIKIDQTKKKVITQDDIKKLKPVDYTKNHNYKDREYSKSLEEKIKERDYQSQTLKEKGFDKFDTDPECGGYGIFNGLGIKNLSALASGDDEEVKTRYKRLLEMRKQDIK